MAASPLARTVQSDLLPPPAYGDSQIRLQSHYQPAAEFGGDWWGFFREGNRMAVFIADATGHGIPSALATASVRGALCATHQLLRARPGAVAMSPGEILPLVNAAVFGNGRSGVHVTCFLAVLDFDKGEISYANAGHCPPWIVSAGGVEPARALVSAGPRLGETPELPPIQAHVTRFASGDTVVFYTDGLIEAKDSSGEMYGKRRARAVIDAFRARGEEALVDAMAKDFLSFGGGRALEDDVTIVAARIL